MIPTVVEVLDALREQTNVLLYGPPATGKTHLMQEVARRFIDEGGGGGQGGLLIDTTQERLPFAEGAASRVAVRWVTFHQSYSYEDFVLGLRPVPQATGPLQLEPVPGVLLHLAANALAGGDSLLLIDEVNRGNASRIFGEFITLLEPEKRLTQDGNESPMTVRVNLPYLGDQGSLPVDVNGLQVTLTASFALPARVYTLATMNSVDKTIAPLDVALRRRFHLMELRSEEADYMRAAGVAYRGGGYPGADDVDHYRLLAVRLLQRLNDGVASFLGPHVELGAWYLRPLSRDGLDPASAQVVLWDLWWNALVPQLEELFEAQQEALGYVLSLGSDTPLRLISPSQDEVQLGALPYVRRAHSSVQQLIDYLRGLADMSAMGSGHGATPADSALSADTDESLSEDEGPTALEAAEEGAAYDEDAPDTGGGPPADEDAGP